MGCGERPPICAEAACWALKGTDKNTSSRSDPGEEGSVASVRKRGRGWRLDYQVEGGHNWAGRLWRSLEVEVVAVQSNRRTSTPLQMNHTSVLAFVAIIGWVPVFCHIRLLFASRV
jgi:hypothetical protein